MTIPIEITRLSDDEIRHIYRKVYLAKPTEQPQFLQSFGLALNMANRRDFLMMRGTAVVFIAKYALGHHLVAIDPPAEKTGLSR